MDTLVIKALQVATHIGVHAWEQKIKQNLLIDISIPSDFSNCKEDLTNTIDYDALCRCVTELVASKSFKLIETVANEVKEFIKQEFKVDKLTVAVSKPNAVANAGTISVLTQE